MMPIHVISSSNVLDFSNSTIESVFIQLSLVILIYSIMFLNNPFYLLLYFFLIVFFAGLSISFYQLEFFTGFLYVLEVTVVFITLILLFYLNFKGSNVYAINEYVGLWPLLFIVTFSVPTIYTEEEGLLPTALVIGDLWDNFYEALHSHTMNDFAGLYISYYIVHSLEFIIIGFMLFIGSVACIMLYVLINSSKRTSLNYTISFLNLYSKLYDMLFLRKQTLTTQSFRRDLLREAVSNEDLANYTKSNN